MFFKAGVAPVLFSLFSCPVFSLQSVWVVCPLLCIYGESPGRVVYQTFKLVDCRVGTLDERHVFDSGRSDELPGIGGVWGWAVSTSI